MGFSKRIEASPTCCFAFFPQRPLEDARNCALCVESKIREDIARRNSASCVPDSRQLLLFAGTGSSAMESYDLYDRLGRGGYGSVYRARCRHTGGMRALKRIALPTEKTADLKDLRVELEAMVRLDHPNVVKLFEFFQDEKYLFIITELCIAGDFADLNHGIDDPGEIKTLFEELFRAMTYCHDQGIAHRDLKFNNCLLQMPPGLRRTTKVIDFGLSAIRGPDDTDEWISDFLGSAFFAAPEVMGGKSYGVKCDCWSAGVMLYAVLTGEHPCINFADMKRARDGDRNVIGPLLQRARINKQPLYLADVDSSVQDLLFGLLVRCPDKRLDARAALHHEWFDKAGWIPFSADHVTDSIVVRLRAFPQYSHFERAVLTLAAHFASSEYVQDLRAAFEQLNASKSGALSKEELIAGTRHHGGEFDADSIFRVLDADSIGKIHYTKWLAGTISPSCLRDEWVGQQIYCFFDPERNGRASKDLLRRLFDVGATVDEVPSRTEFQALLAQVANNLERQCEFEKGDADALHYSWVESIFIAAVE